MNNVININAFRRARGITKSNHNLKPHELSWTIRMPWSEYERLSHQVRLLRLRVEEAQARLLKELQAIR